MRVLNAVRQTPKSCARLTRTLAAGLSLAVAVACGYSEVEVSGDRAVTGACPETVCSPATPLGLTFVGVGFYDDAAPRLGPITAGGQFDLGVYRPDGGEIPPFRIEVEEPEVLDATPSNEPYNAQRVYAQPVSDHVVITGASPGYTTVRVVEADTGLLLDRLTLQVDEISQIRVISVNNPDRSYLVAGEDELIGIRLMIGDNSTPQRAIDQSIKLAAVGDTQPENMYWDCYSYRVPENVDEVTFVVTSGNTETEHVFEVRDAESVR